ncbi:bifunctional [glutamine synthetase] adenylyltransferase/[glutamine synthetase]-adenylyl-L-tyrosine phosphorylase [Actinotalea ferrariae]|uniref:bifunctional [glutamine synthetase] adenylyltransferase/[glutamine synthetase]-adenylyl-L-tyrosine phosphorylase n=1 Tax=Actinotalea ferrariae TaxID=1386098 RepID=UPI001C8B49FD|nr:bifunctional [glutamine synthetase] adenylyltransferase/[glutamine synthetase]-adenylyl-L-tyrosine phosphorylase [Actinotalea ferrariae]MBX9244679.1 bifunctional [glutamine synthetase] adenylyltransferase/[glutamine synthetase]-adenylyl-L-tyrosine phosphorylase [Actinotalea ferrariae]
MSETTADGRRRTLRARLTRLGFTDTERACTLLDDADLVAVTGTIDEAAPLLEALAHVASPDDALLALTRLSGACRAAGETSRCGLRDVLATPSAHRDGLLAVLGASSALADHLVRHPRDLAALAERSPIGADVGQVRAELLAAVGAPDLADAGVVGPVATVVGDAGVDALRRAYRRRLLRIAATDLLTAEPLSLLPAVAAALADLAAAALEGALALARAEHPHEAAVVRLAVIGMGKCGGRELNYVSDVDVVHVAEPAEGCPEDEAMRAGAKLATALARVCSGPSGEPALWPVDAALRPEGKNGPLVRTVESHVSYYERWAKTWEFQALLKARVVAGDRELGARYTEAIAPFVWSAVERENFVEDSQAMRRRVEQHVPASEADRQLKLGVGGLRDVEFTVQLLQLVHGRSDESIRSASTLTALSALAAGGYVGRDHASRLAVCYRLLRVLEHRIQLHRLRRTHLMPTAEADLRRLARSIGMRAGGADEVTERWRSVRRDVRHLHEELFYRPLLPATASLSREDVTLAPDAARARLAAIGYRDPAGALRHIAALTEGVSRRAAIQRQLLPVLLGWFAEGTDPDAGLLAFRRLSDELGATHWYLKLLRDSGAAAQRLARLLSTSRYVADALARSPESVAWLDDDAELAPRDRARLEAEADAVLTRQSESAVATTLLRALRRREMARTAVAEVLGSSSVTSATASLTAAADVVLAGALRIAEYEVREGPDGVLTRNAIIAMGRLGGSELGYGSDADVLFVHDPLPGVDEGRAQAQAMAVAARVRALLGEVGPEPALEVDAGLRPEGRNGPLVRTLASYGEYYQRWSSPWESQALLRARPVAGDAALGDRFVALVDPLRFPAGGADAAAVREVRRLKARMEAERLPRGVDPGRHLKLGRGGLSDVEWTVQLLQLQHGHAVEGLRTPRTLEALDAAAGEGLVAADDAAVLREAWLLSSRLRDALVLWSGRAGGAGADVLPHDGRALSALARLLGFGPGSGAELEEMYLRTGRRARAVVERLFYG